MDETFFSATELRGQKSQKSMGIRSEARKASSPVATTSQVLGQRLRNIPTSLKKDSKPDVQSHSNTDSWNSTSDSSPSPMPGLLNKDKVLMDMNMYPKIDKIRVMLAYICLLSFLVAPCVYIPLGYMQAAYDQRCFLYTKPYVVYEHRQNITAPFVLRLDPVKTKWGSKTHCDFTTYSGVVSAISSIIMGWVAVQLWPVMMAFGQGGVLAALYSLYFLLMFIGMVTSSNYIRSGFRETCSSIFTTSTMPMLTCQSFDGKTVELTNYDGIINNLQDTIHLVEVASWTLTGLSFTQFFLSIYAFGLICVYFYYTNQQNFSEESSNLAEYPESPQLLKTLSNTTL